MQAVAWGVTIARILHLRCDDVALAASHGKKAITAAMPPATQLHYSSYE